MFRVVIFIFSSVLLLHSLRDFLHYKKSDFWYAVAGHKKFKYYFDLLMDKLGLSWMKDKELLHSFICLIFGILFLILGIKIG